MFRCPTSELPIWPGRQPDGLARGLEPRVRPAREQARARPASRAAAMASAARVGADPEAVDDDQHDRPRPAVRRHSRRASGGRRGRARAGVRPARATIAAISSGLSEAPPTSAPSIAGSAMNSSMFDDVTLPPYRIGIVLAAVRRSRGPPSVARIAPGHLRRVRAPRVAPGPDRPDRLVGDRQRAAAPRPRPTRAAGSAPARQPRTWPVDDLQRPPGFALGELLADAQDHAQPAASRARGASGRSARPSRRRRGAAREWPTIAHVARPAQHRRARSRRCTRRRPRGGRPGRRRRRRGRPAPRRRSAASASRTAARHTNGGHSTRVTPSTRGPRRRWSRASSPASAGVVCIFQLPATITGRIGRIMPARAARCAPARAGPPIDGSPAGPRARRASPRASRAAPPRRPAPSPIPARGGRRALSAAIASSCRPAATTVRARFADSALITRLSSPRRVRATWRASSSSRLGPAPIRRRKSWTVSALFSVTTPRPAADAPARRHARLARAGGEHRRLVGRRRRARGASGRWRGSASPATGTGRGARPSGSARAGAAQSNARRRRRVGSRRRRRRGARAGPPSRASVGSRRRPRRLEAGPLRLAIARRATGRSPRQLGPQRERRGRARSRPRQAVTRPRGPLAAHAPAPSRSMARRIAAARRAGSWWCGSSRLATRVGDEVRHRLHRRRPARLRPRRPATAASSPVEPVVRDHEVDEVRLRVREQRLDVIREVVGPRSRRPGSRRCRRRRGCPARAATASRIAGIRRTGRTLVYRLPGPRTTMSASAIAATASSAASTSRRLDPDPLDARRSHDRRLAADRDPVARPRDEVDRASPTPARPCRAPRGRGSSAGRPPRSRRPRAPSSRRAAGCRPGGRRARPARSRPDRSSIARAAGEAVAEELAHERLGVGERRDAVADVADRRDPELLAQRARRAAVVGHGHDRRDVARVLLEPAQERREARPAADRDDPRPAREELASGR